MKIRVQIFGILVTLIVILNALILGSARLIILGSFTRLERRYMTEHVERAIAALSDRLEKMDYTIHDWSSWTDTRDFLAGNHEEYVAENFMDAAFVSLNVNLIALLDQGDKLVFAKAVDIESGLEIPLPEGFDTLVAPGSPIFPKGGDRPSSKGVVLLPGSILIAVARPVLDSNGEGPSTGTMVMGRFLDNSILDSFSDIIRLPLSLYRLDDMAGLPNDFREAHGSLSPENPVTVRIPDSDLIAGYALIPDIRGNPVLMLKVEAGREIHASGQRTIFLFMAGIILLSLVVGAALWLLLQKVILRRLARLSIDAARIRERGDLSGRIAVSGDDELSDVNRALNSMLDALKHSQARLRQAQRNDALAKLAGGTAHEFNNILAMMQGSIELVIDTFPEGDPRRVRLEQAYRSGEKGKDIVGRVLEFSRTSHQARTVVSLSTIVPDTLAMVQSLFPPHVSLIQHIAVNTRSIRATVVQIEQVIINLCKNAIEAIGDRPGTVEILVEDVVFGGAPERYPELEPGTWVRLVVKDDGKGMLPSASRQIFDPFFTTKEIGKGVGLGLSVARGIMEQHHGWIGFASEYGKGTSFELLFPSLGAGTCNSVDPDNSSALLDGETVAGGRLLFVDSQADRLEIPIEALKTLGYQVDIAKDSGKARDLVSDPAGAFDLILVSKEGTDMDGLELCRALHDIHREVALILYAEEGGIMGSLEMDDAGIHDFLQKPLTIRSLVDAIDQVLDRIAD